MTRSSLLEVARASTTCARRAPRASASARRPPPRRCATRCCRSSRSSACQLGALLGGAVLTETIFNLAGVGRIALRGDHRPRLRRDPGLHPRDRRQLRGGQPDRRRVLRASSIRGSGCMTARASRCRRAPPSRSWPTDGTTRPASLWRDTLGEHPPPALGGRRPDDPRLPRLHGDLRRRSSRRTTRPGAARHRARAVKQRAPPCIHLLGCPADQPQHLFGTRRQRPRRVQPGRLRRAGLAGQSGFCRVGFAIIVGTLDRRASPATPAAGSTT